MEKAVFMHSPPAPNKSVISPLPPQLFPIGHNLDPAVLVGAQQRITSQGFQSLTIRAAIAVIGGHRERNKSQDRAPAQGALP